MPIYFCKAPDVVMTVLNDDQINSVTVADPVGAYGPGTYIVVDLGGPAPENNTTTLPNGDVIPGAFRHPTITAAMQSASTKQECKRRILTNVSEQAQRNIATYINDIQMDRMTEAPARPPTPAEQADMDTAAAIWDWIGRPNGMQQASDDMIAANDLEWYQDVKWPPWNAAWDAFVARF